MKKIAIKRTQQFVAATSAAVMLMTAGGTPAFAAAELPVPIPASLLSEAAAETFEEGGFTYTITSPDTVQLGNGTEKAVTATGAVSIPSEVSHLGQTYRVTSIGALAFRFAGGVTSVSIPASIETIDDQAFDRFNSEREYTVDPNSTAFSAKDGVLFNKQQTQLVRYPSQASASSYTVPAGVTSIAPYAFQYSGEKGNWMWETVDRGLSTIVLPEGLLSIGDYAFEFSGLLTDLELPDGLQSIGSYAFEKTNLKSVVIPNTVSHLDTYAFSMCDNLTSVTLSSQLTAIPEGTFSQCGALRKYDVPAGITEIGDKAFWNCSNLSTVSVPDSVEHFGASAFDFTTSLETITFGENSALKTIGEKCFQNSNIRHLSLPAGVTTIGPNAFNLCTALTSVEIPADSKLTTIEEGGFKGCTVLASVSLPADVTSIAPDAFQDCDAVTAFAVSPQNKTYSSPGGVLMDKDQTTLYFYPQGSAASSYTMPDTVTTLMPRAVYGVKNLEEITLSSILETVGDFAFSQNKNLKSISFPDTVTTLGKSVLLSCSSLESVRLPEGIAALPDGTFNGCSSLASLTLPAAMNTISASDPLSSCTALTQITILSPDFQLESARLFPQSASITVVNETVKENLISAGIDGSRITVEAPETVDTFAVSGITYKVLTQAAGGQPGTVQIGDGIQSNKVSGPLTIPGTVSYQEKDYTVVQLGVNAFADQDKITGTVRIPDSVHTISQNAFGNCTGITGVEFGTGLRTISHGAFVRTGLTEVEIPATVQSVGRQAFAGCPDLTQVTFAEESPIDAVSESLFRGSSRLSSVTLPRAVTKINESAFAGTALTAAPLHEGITMIARNAFRDCSSLVSAAIPSTVTLLNDGAFAGCEKLSSVTFAENSVLQQIGLTEAPDAEEELSGVFADCTSLEKIVLPASLRVVGGLTFSGCSALSDIEFLSPEIDRIAAGAFSGLARNFVITVPSQAVKDTVVDQGLVAPSSVRINSAAENVLSLTALPAGGIGKQVRATVEHPGDGWYLLVQVTNPEKVNSIYTIPVPANGIADLSFDTDSHISVWVTETQPQLIADAPNAGGQILGSAAM